MNEILRKQLWRKLESLPDDKAYQLLDYIEFLEARSGGGTREASGFQRFSEVLQGTLRRRNVPVTALRETMRALGTTDRFLTALKEAGREFLAEVEGGRPEPPPTPEEPAPPQTHEIDAE